MALNDRKITTYANPVANLPDHPSQEGWTAATLKAAFDAIANEEVKHTINGIIDDLIAVLDGASGADQIGATAITDLDGATVQAILESLRNKLKSIVDGSSGADFIGATAITNLDGTTVQAILESLRNKLKSIVDGSSGADFIGATALKPGGAITVQGQLKELLANINTVNENEATRVLQESARVTAENARSTAETSRANAETSRVNAESLRATAESNRESAEQLRVEADILRGQTVEEIEANYAPRLTSAEEQINDLDAEVVDINNVLELKAEQSFVDSQFASIVSGAPKGTYTDLTALQTAYPTGTDGVMLVLADGHWYYWNSTTSAWTDGGAYQATGINNSSVTPKKTTIFEYSKNMFNGIVTEGYVISSSNGTLEPNAPYRTSDFIEVLPNTKYTLWGWLILAYYTKEKTFISRPYANNGNSITITTPANCYFIRLATSFTPRSQQLYQGEYTLTQDTYVSFYERVKPEHIYINNENMISSKIVSKGNTAFYDNRTFNLFNGKITEKYLITDTGEPATDANYRTSDFIAVEPSTKYTPYEWLKVVFYAEDKKFISISGTGNSPFITPANCYFVRLCTSITNRNQMLLKGDFNAFYYEAFKETILQDDIQKPRWKDKTYFSPEKLRGYYYAPIQTAWNPLARNVNDIYGIYDTLLTANSGYITKTNLGKDQSGLYDVFQYNFKPSYPVSSNTKQHLPKIVIFSGVHGLERWSIYAIAKLMEDICKNYNSSEILEYLRHNVEFVIVPLVNPWGYIEGTRWNSNGVDINRNFDFNWAVSGIAPFNNYYEGTSPFSEIETKYVKKVLIQNLDALAVIDGHTHDVTSWNEVYWHICSSQAKSYDDIANISKSNLSVMTYKMKEKYSLVFNGFIGNFDYANTAALMGYSGAVLGINTVTAEATDKIPSEPQSGTALTNQLNVEFFGNLVCNIIKNFN